MKKVLLILLSVAAVWAQGADPYVGYIYPCGIQAGTTNRLIVGGQGLGKGGVRNAIISGEGVKVLSIEAVPRFSTLPGPQFRYLAKWLDGIAMGNRTAPPLPTSPRARVEEWRTNRWWQILGELDEQKISIVERALYIRRNPLQSSPSLGQRLLVTVAAFDRLGLDRAGVHVFTMPGFGTTKRTRGNAEDLAEGLGLKLKTIDITAACRQHFKDIGQSERVHDITYENAQARERTQILMDKANQFNGIVVGTGDMSEIALGWCTYNGDHMSMFGVNAGVPKTVVREVCRWWAEGKGAGGLAAKALLDIIATPVSPELLPSKRGKIAQKTEDKVGPYELHDFFLWHFVAEQAGRAEILKAAKKAFKKQYPASVIAKWLDVFFRRLFSQSFKRNCAPDGVPVFSVYLAPSAWHVPSDISNGVFV